MTYSPILSEHTRIARLLNELMYFDYDFYIKINYHEKEEYPEVFKNKILVTGMNKNREIGIDFIKAKLYSNILIDKKDLNYFLLVTNRKEYLEIFDLDEKLYLPLKSDGRIE